MEHTATPNSCSCSRHTPNKREGAITPSHHIAIHPALYADTSPNIYNKILILVARAQKVEACLAGTGVVDSDPGVGGDCHGRGIFVIPDDWQV